MILTVTLNPSVDHALLVDQIRLNDTNRVKRTERDAGGKGVNVARVAAELGAQVAATGILAGGPGAYVKSVLDAQGVRNDFVQVPGETRVNFSVEDISGLPPTTFNEPGPEVSADSFLAVREHVRRMAQGAHWVCLGGSLPPGVPSEAFRLLIEDARSCGCATVLDADGEVLRLGLEARPTFVKPNVREAERLLGRRLATAQDCVDAARIILERLSPAGPRAALVVISRGSEGAILVSEDIALLGESPQVEVNSSIGSGDSLIGGMLWAFEAGMPLQEALCWGLAAGAATATTSGNEIARRPMVEKLLPDAKVSAL